MPDFVNIIDYYGNGSTGTVALTNGESVDYTISTNIGEGRVQKNYGEFTGSVAVQSNENDNFFEVSFSQSVTNIVMGITASDAGDGFAVLIDGVEVDLLDLLNQGLITISDPAAHIVNSNGQLEGDGGPTREVTYIQFNFALTSIGATGGIDSPTGPSGIGVDFFEIGVNDATDAVCFCAGTLIETEDGPQAVETLEQGARILTQDGTFAPLRCVVSTTLQSWELALKPKLRPIRIAAGALGKGLPQQDLHVSPQHRMLVSSKIANRVCDANEVLVAAKKLSSLPGIGVDDSIDEVSYYHLIFDEHQIIYANGAPTESLYLGEEALKALTPQARAEVLALFPELLLDSPPLPVVAAPIPSGRDQKQLVARHAKNKRDLLSNYPRMDKQA